METLSACPVCKGPSFRPYLETKDLYTAESFNLQQCPSCTFIFTNPRPNMTEIGPYYANDQYISHTSHSNSLMSKIYRIARKFMLGKKYKMLKPYLGKTLLDYGSGTGDFLSYFKEKGQEVTGVEFAENARETAKNLHGIKTLSIEEGAKLKPKSQDVVTLWHVLEHMHDLEEKLAYFKDILTENGTLLIAVPNINSYDGQHYGKNWHAIDVPRHLYHFTPHTLKLLLKKWDFTCVAMHPLPLDAYYVSMWSEWSIGSSKISGITKALYRGFISNLKGKTDKNYSSLAYVFKPIK